MLQEWTEFDGWCAVKNIDPLELPSRRFINLALWYMREGHDEEGKAKIKAELDRAALLPHPIYQLFKIYAPKPLRTKRPSTLEGVEVRPRTIGGWVKPEGWVPPGWKDDATAYRDAMRVASGIRRP